MRDIPKNDIERESEIIQQTEITQKSVEKDLMPGFPQIASEEVQVIRDETSISTVDIAPMSLLDKEALFLEKYKAYRTRVDGGGDSGDYSELSDTDTFRKLKKDEFLETGDTDGLPTRLESFFNGIKDKFESDEGARA